MAKFSVGDRVRITRRLRGMHRSLRWHMELGHEARVLRVRWGLPTRLLVRFDETDAMYGMHWVSVDVVCQVSDDDRTPPAGEGRSPLSPRRTPASGS